MTLIFNYGARMDITQQTNNGISASDLFHDISLHYIPTIPQI